MTEAPSPPALVLGPKPEDSARLRAAVAAARERPADADARVELADTLRSLGLGELALTQLTAARAASPGHPGAAALEMRVRNQNEGWLRRLAIYSLRQDRRQVARAFAEQAVALGNGRAWTWTVLARARYVVGDRDGAATAARTALEQDPDTDDAMRILRLATRTDLAPEEIRRELADLAEHDERGDGGDGGGDDR